MPTQHPKPIAPIAEPKKKPQTPGRDDEDDTRHTQPNEESDLEQGNETQLPTPNREKDIPKA